MYTFLVYQGVSKIRYAISSYHAVFGGFIDYECIEDADDSGNGAVAGYEFFAGDGYFIVSDFGVDVIEFFDGVGWRGSQTATGQSPSR